MDDERDLKICKDDDDKVMLTKVTMMELVDYQLEVDKGKLTAVANLKS